MTAIGDKIPSVVEKLDAHKPVRTRIDRTSAGLRNALFDEIDALRKGNGNPQRAMAIAKLAQNILAAAKMEYQVQRAEDPTTPPSLSLGGPSDGV